MIGRVYRGGKVGGLLRYLYGPGRANEHENPHLVAAWDLESAAELATLEPLVLSGEGASAVRDFGPMTASMELATSLRRIPATVAARQVWHCPLRVAPGDRTLTDEEWAQVARDVMHRTGIAERGDDGGCRWIAVRHDEHSVHLVAVLARQDGRPVRLSHDHLRVRQACREAETRLGLLGTAPADRTAATHSTRAEVEKAVRKGGVYAMTDREWLREQVQLAAINADTASAFLEELQGGGVLVRERRDPDGLLTGYAVARATAQVRPGEEPVFFGGGKLAPDLSLPKLQTRWHDQAAVAPLQVVVGGVQPTPLRRATAVIELAAGIVKQAAADPDPAAQDEAGAVAGATAQVLAAAARATEGDVEGVLTRAARVYDRASREPDTPRLVVTPHSRALQDVALALLRGGRLTDSASVALLGQVLLLVDSVRQLREAQGRLAQASSARRTVGRVHFAVQEQKAKLSRALAVPSPAQAVTAAPPAYRPGPAVPRPAVGRRR
ncbi:MAG: hypothetical protein JWO60_2262 [Frankiales bacterium]|nr:hypothetical protein [Frankiales bacterium]